MLATENRYDPRLYKLNGNLPKKVLEARLRTVDRRLTEIQTTLSGNDDSYRAQELHHEQNTLLAMRRHIESVLRPAPKPKFDPARVKALAEQRERDRRFIKMAIKERLDSLERAARKEEAAGNHRQARLWREQLPLVPEAICAEYDKDLALLTEIDLD